MLLLPILSHNIGIETSLTSRYALGDYLRALGKGLRMVSHLQPVESGTEPSGSGDPGVAPMLLLPLPVALAKLSPQAGADTPLDTADLVNRYGENPASQSISMLSETLGLEVRPTTISPSALCAEHLPALLVMPQGGALLAHRISDDGLLVVEGPSGRQSLKKSCALEGWDGVLLQCSPTPPGADDKQDNAPVTDVLPWLFGLIRTHARRDLSQLVTASLISNLFLIALPLFIMSVYDRVIPHNATETLITLAIGIGLILSVDLGLRYVRLKFIDAVGLRIGRTLQSLVYRRLLTTPLVQRPKSAASLTNIQGEVEALCLGAPELASSLIADSAFALMVLCLVASIGGPIVLVPIAGMAAVALVIVWGATRSREAAKLALMAKTASAHQIAETVVALGSVKAAGAEHQLLKRYERLGSQSALTLHAARQRMRFASQAAGVIVQITVVLTVCMGVLRIGGGLMTIGSLAAITLLVGRAVSPVGLMADQICRLRALRDVVNGTLQLISLEEDKGGERDGAGGRTINGDLALNHITFHYPGSAQPALNDISLKINSGDRIGIVGRNGCGKSTLLHLLPRLYFPAQGDYSIDQHDARQFDPQTIRRQIAFMPQETVLFHRTLKENICLGMDSVPEEDFERAVRIAGVDRFVSQHPKGYSLDVGPRGEYLSAGERQAVGLARALLRPRPVLVLDEPTSMMDQHAEVHVVNALGQYAANKTLIVSTHRLRLLNIVSRVITLESGRIVSDLPREEALSGAVRQKAAS